MCKYCEENKTIMSATTINPSVVAFCNGIKSAADIDAFEVATGIFIDRGYLRLTDLEEDCDCLDHGDKVKINFCPFCGNKMWIDCKLITNKLNKL